MATTFPTNALTGQPAGVKQAVLLWSGLVSFAGTTASVTAGVLDGATATNITAVSCLYRKLAGADIVALINVDNSPALGVQWLQTSATAVALTRSQKLVSSSSIDVALAAATACTYELQIYGHY